MLVIPLKPCEPFTAKLELMSVVSYLFLQYLFKSNRFDTELLEWILEQPNMAASATGKSRKAVSKEEVSEKITAVYF